MFKRSFVLFLLVALAMLCALVSACGAETGGTTSTAPTATVGKPNCVSGTLQVTGSTALQPLVQDVANEYQKQCSGAKITVGGGGSGTGVQNVFDGSSGIGNSDVYADATKYAGLVDHQVAVVVFSIVLNEKVTGVTNLTAAQMKDIYTGVKTNWKDLGGPDLAIVPVSRPAGSGTRVTFETYVLGAKEGLPPGATNPSAGSSGEVATSVKGTDGAVSYVTTDFAKKNGLKVVKLDGAEDSDANVKNNTYKFWNVEHMYTKGQPTDLAKALIDYVQSPATASIRQKQGFLDITTMTKEALDAKGPKS
jgi:phosphate transport system substrate-binding protein